MDQVDRPRGLIRFDSMEGIKNNVKLKFTPRVIGYTTVLLVLLTTLTVLFAQRKDLDINILRTPGMLFQKQPDDKISNMYNLKVSNKTFTEMPLEFRLIDNDGEIKLIEHEINLKLTNTPLKIEILSGRKQIDIVNTTFLGPQN